MSDIEELSYITRAIRNIITSALQAEGRRFEPVNSHD